MEYTYEGFVQLVKQMRDAQKNYLHKRNTPEGSKALAHLMELERSVDFYITKL
jgi:hypothetical protein